MSTIVIKIFQQNTKTKLIKIAHFSPHELGAKEGNADGKCEKYILQ